MEIIAQFLVAAIILFGYPLVGNRFTSREVDRPLVAFTPEGVVRRVFLRRRRGSALHYHQPRGLLVADLTQPGLFETKLWRLRRRAEIALRALGRVARPRQVAAYRKKLAPAFALAVKTASTGPLVEMIIEVETLISRLDARAAFAFHPEVVAAPLVVETGRFSYLNREPIQGSLLSVFSLGKAGVYFCEKQGVPAPVSRVVDLATPVTPAAVVAAPAPVSGVVDLATPVTPAVVAAPAPAAVAGTAVVTAQAEQVPLYEAQPLDSDPYTGALPFEAFAGEELGEPLFAVDVSQEELEAARPVRLQPFPGRPAFSSRK